MRQSESRTKFIRNLKITVERTFCTLCHLPININGETSLFILFVEMMDVPALEQMLSSGQHCKETILRHNVNCYNLYQMCPMTSVGEGPGFHNQVGVGTRVFPALTQLSLASAWTGLKASASDEVPQASLTVTMAPPKPDPSQWPL